METLTMKKQEQMIMDIKDLDTDTTTLGDILEALDND